MPLWYNKVNYTKIIDGVFKSTIGGDRTKDWAQRHKVLLAVAALLFAALFGFVWNKLCMLQYAEPAPQAQPVEAQPAPGVHPAEDHPAPAEQ